MELTEEMRYRLCYLTLRLAIDAKLERDWGKEECAGVLTFLDYTWNPEAYDPKTSLRNAQILMWGKDAPDAANDARQQAVELYDYLFNARPKKGKGTQEEAMVKFVELEKAVKRLAGVIGNSTTSGELDADCLGQARTAIKKVFPD